MRIAVVGATGLVGSVILKVLEEQDFPYDELLLAASEKSIGMSLSCKRKNYLVHSIAKTLELKPDIAIFSAGGSVSKEWAPKFAAAGCFVIDNSSAWRMYPEIPLVVPEINAHTITAETKIIANPNCSTIQMVLALSKLHLKYSIKRIVVSTYQSVSGTGAKALNQLFSERDKMDHEPVYPHPIDLNILPHGGNFEENGYTSEETKLINETRKIYNDASIQISPTVVRVPVTGGHSESVNVEFHADFQIGEVFSILKKTPGVVVLDDPASNLYPMPRFAEGKDEVFIGRIRRDLSAPNALNCWIVADNLRKGAATNAVQIAQYLLLHFPSCFHQPK